MLRISMQNFVRLTVLIGSISSVAANQPLTNLKKLAASLVDWVVGC
jgi:hypothetical protein